MQTLTVDLKKDKEFKNLVRFTAAQGLNSPLREVYLDKRYTIGLDKVEAVSVTIQDKGAACK